MCVMVLFVFIVAMPWCPPLFAAAVDVMERPRDWHDPFNASAVRWAGVRSVSPEPLSVLTSDKMPKFDEGRLLRVAETHGYGYKLANLIELSVLVEWFNEHAAAPLPVKVPEFFGIPSERIVRGLQARGFSAGMAWREVVETVVSEEDRADVMGSKNFPDEFWIAQREFSKNLENAFDRMIRANFAKSLELITGYVGADAVVEDVRRVQDAFMVRSTGKEDTRTMANAGGNESVVNVLPNKAALLEAAKKVVLSYFGEKSLKQRLGLGDPSLFSQDVFCPVFIQRMVGERDDADIPVCGVMFTEEPEGGISWRNEKDDAGVIKTTGITTIQAAYGHNEGVVNSKVAVDTVIAQQLPGVDDPVFYPVIRAKRERLVPVPGEAALTMKENPAHLVLAAALNNKMLITLKKFADALEKYYGYPVDVEFVVRDGIVYIVQARPIVHKSERATPSYLPLLGNLPAECIFKGRTIGVAGGSVVTLLQKKEAIMMPTIGGALDVYLKHLKRDSVKAIIIGADAPATSHEATTFRSEGKPVIFVRNFHQLAEAFRGDKKLIFSPLQHCVVVMPTVAELEIHDGWCAYPLAPELSVVDALFLSTDSLPIMPFKRAAVPKIQTDSVAWPILLTQMKEGSREQVVSATAQLSTQCFSEIKKYTDRKLSAGTFAAHRFDLQLAIRAVCQRVVAFAHIEKESPLYAIRLLPIVYLEALVTQWPNLKEVAAPWSMAMLVDILKREAKPASLVPEKFGTKENEELFNQLKQFEDKIFDENSRSMWLALINAVATHNESIFAQRLSTLVARLQEFDLLAMWLHTSMGSDVRLQMAINKGVLDSRALDSLFKGWILPLYRAQGFLQEIKKLRERVSSFQLNGFDDPKKFTVMWNQFKATLLNVVNATAFKEAFDVANLTARLAACFMLDEFIDLFDRAIKAVKGSSNYKPLERASRFKEMLTAYNAFLQQLITLIPEGAIQYGASTQNDFLQLVTNVLRRDFTAADLEGTSGFNVAAFTIGSGVDVATTHPQPATGEDAFTTIHQDLLVGVSTLIKIYGGADIKRPELLKVVEDEIKNLRGSRMHEGIRPPSLIGCNITMQGVKLHYNFPLRSHSCQFFLNYDHRDNHSMRRGERLPKVYLTVQFYGHNPYRWFNMAGSVALASFSGACAVQDFVITENGMACTFMISGDGDIGAVIRIIDAMIKFSFKKGLDGNFFQGITDLVGRGRLDINVALEEISKKFDKKLLVFFEWIFEPSALRSLDIANTEMIFEGFLSYWAVWLQENKMENLDDINIMLLKRFNKFFEPYKLKMAQRVVLGMSRVVLDMGSDSLEEGVMNFFHLYERVTCFKASSMRTILIQQVIAIGDHLARNEKISIALRVYGKFLGLVESDGAVYYDAACHVASRAMESVDHNVLIAAVNLFKALVTKFPKGTDVSQLPRGLYDNANIAIERLAVPGDRGELSLAANNLKRSLESRGWLKEEVVASSDAAVVVGY